MKKLKSLALLVLIVVSASFATPTLSAQVESPPSIREIDRIRLAEVFSVSDRVGESLWPGWNKAPFAVLLVTPEHEFLFRHPKPSADFTKIGFDNMLGADVYYRARKFPTSFLATFPAINGSMISTIVVGQAENTWVKTSTPWVITLIHEHFHQLQDSQQNFYAEVNALDLSGGDQTGMWMLNYAFPYDRAEVQGQFAVMSASLADAIQTTKQNRREKVEKYLVEREKFRALISPADYRYLNFQFWKEGIARYTEYHIARLAAAKHRPSRQFRSLSDYRSYRDVSTSTYNGILEQLQKQKLGETKREVVYAFGAAEGLLLDQINPGWRSKYFVEKFDLGRFLGCARC